MSEIKIKPCPFCGGYDLEVRDAPEPAPGQKAAMSESRITTYIVFARDKHGRERKISIPWVGRHEPTTSDISRAIVYALGDDSPEPAPGDRERARLYLSGFHVELYDGINRADIEPQKVIDSLAAEFARVREAATKKERERCERVAESLYGKTYWDDPVAGIAAAIRRGEP